MAAGSGSERGLVEYLIPLLALLAYFFTAKRKKHPSSAPIKNEEETQPPHVVKHKPIKSLPSTSIFSSSIEQRQITSAIEMRNFSSSINESPLLSSGLFSKEELDPSYAKKFKQTSRAKKILSNRSSLCKALIIQEILKRPFE